jgi:predicted DsbA family dithiol-disulfide isomerase
MLDPDGDYLVSAWRNHVYPLAAAMEMHMKRPPVQPRSRFAHEAAKWADSQGSLEEYHLAIFRAFFEYGKDIGDIEVLKKLAADLKLDADSLEASLKDRTYSSLVLEDTTEAGRIGIRAVPSFVIAGDLQASGVQPIERLRELIFRAGKFL